MVFHLGYGRFFTWISLSLSSYTVQESLFKISLEHHTYIDSFVPEHLKIDCEVGLLNILQLERVASRLVYVLVVEGKFQNTLFIHVCLIRHIHN